MPLNVSSIDLACTGLKMRAVANLEVLNEFRRDQHARVSFIPTPSKGNVTHHVRLANWIFEFSAKGQQIDETTLEAAIEQVRGQIPSRDFKSRGELCLELCLVRGDDTRFFLIAEDQFEAPYDSTY